MPQVPRILAALAAVLAAGLAAPAWAQSPEFYQILNEVNGSLKVLAPSITRGPVCAPMMVDQAKQGLQANLFSSAANKVVIEPLEAGAKVALGAAGVPGAAISTYSAVRCAMNAADGRDFVRCLLGETIGFKGGELLEALGVDSLEGAIAGYAWDQAYGSIRGAIEGYGATSESIEWSAGGDCRVDVTAQWNKRRQPGAEGGQVVVIARVSECRCRAANELRQGSLRFVVPVSLVPTGSAQPGFRAGEPRQYNMTVVCCGGPAERTIGFLPGGGIAPPPGRDPPVTPPKPPPKPPRTATGGGGSSPPPVAIPGGAPPRPPAGPAAGATPPRPPAVAWTAANPCPACEPLAARLRESEAEERRLAPELARARTALRRTMDAIFDAGKRIAEIESRLGALAGTGGSGVDPETGITTSSVVQADGTVRITRTGRDGQVIDTSTRPYATAAKLKADLAAAQAELAAAKGREPGETREVSRLDSALREAERRTNALRAELEACIETRCRGGAEPAGAIGVVGGGGPVRPPAKPGEAGKQPARKSPGTKEGASPVKEGAVDKEPPPKPPLAAPAPVPSIAGCTLCEEQKDYLAAIRSQIRSYREVRARDFEFRDEAHRRALAKYQALADEYRTIPKDPALDTAKAFRDFLERNAEFRAAREAFERADDATSSSDTRLYVLQSEELQALDALLECLKRCQDLYPEVRTVISVQGNNPFDPRDPLGGRRTGGTPVPPPVPGQPGSLSFSLTAYQGGEGAVAVVSVVRTGGRTGAVGVQYASAGGSATEGVDYTRAAGSLSWADGDDQPRTFSIALTDDNLVEGPESFTVTLSGPTGGASLGAIASATVTIADNDLAPLPQPAGTLQFANSEIPVTEGGTASLVVTRTGGSAGRVTVAYNTGAGSATAGADYTPATGTLVWENGDTAAKSIPVATIDDTAVEGPESFFVNLTNPTGGAILGNPNVAVVTINDNDVASGPCGPSGHAWQPNTGASYFCSGSCSPTPSPQAVTVSGTTVTVSPFHAGGAATFDGCTSSLNSTSSTLVYFGQANHRATITRTGNNAFSANIVSSGGGSCSFSCSRSGP